MLGEDFFQPLEQTLNIFLTGGVAHQPDAPYLTLEFPQPARNFDVMPFQQMLPHHDLIHTFGNPDSGERGQPSLLWHKQSQVKGSQSIP